MEDQAQECKEETILQTRRDTKTAVHSSHAISGHDGAASTIQITEHLHHPGAGCSRQFQLLVSVH